MHCLIRRRKMKVITNVVLCVDMKSVYYECIVYIWRPFYLVTLDHTIFMTFLFLSLFSDHHVSKSHPPVISVPTLYFTYALYRVCRFSCTFSLSFLYALLFCIILYCCSHSLSICFSYALALSLCLSSYHSLDSHIILEFATIIAVCSYNTWLL